MSSLRNLIWALIILCLSHCNIYCFTPSRQNVVNLPSMMPGSINFQTREQQQQQKQKQQHDEGIVPLTIQHVDDNERAVYDPGDELLKVFNSDENPDDYFDMINNKEYESNTIDDKNNLLRKLEHDIQNDQEIISKLTIMMKFLEDPNLETLPIIYFEESSPMPDDGMKLNELLPTDNIAKRSRYYRRYPWKRHNRSRGQYEPDARFLCVPSKDDVLKLLVGLHQNRNGNQQKTVTFCNRKRPAKAIFTNIRFLG